jgi:CcmD family protein
VSNLGWLAVGFGIVWLVLGLYLVRLWRAQRAIERRLEELAARRGGDEKRDLG